MTELDELTLELIERAGGVDVHHIPKKRGGGRLFLIAGGSFIVSRLAIDRLVAAGRLDPAQIRDRGLP